jgi:predicted NBD/HSP70 family sugar kinase
MAATGKASGRTSPTGREPAHQGSLRARNLALVLGVVAESPDPVSRADVSAITGLTRATVSSLVDAMVAGGLIAEVEPRQAQHTGRPATGLVVAGHVIAGLGVEINIDYVSCCLLDLAGQVRHRAVLRQDQRGRDPQGVLLTVTGLVATARRAARRLGLTVAGVGVGVPGLVDVQEGRLLVAANLDWRDVDIRGMLSGLARLGTIGVTVDNEANLAALGELQVVRTRLPANFLYVSGEIGIGAGIILAGALFRGARGWSGELGHMTVSPDGPACRCGSCGCLELFAGQDAIMAGAGLTSQVPLSSRSTVDHILEAARRDDPATLAALRRAGHALGVTLASAVNFFDIGCVVLGGIYTQLGPWIKPLVEHEIARRVLSDAWSPVTVRYSQAGTDGAVLGAAAAITRPVLADPAQWLAATAPKTAH